MNDTEITSSNDLVKLVRASNPGDTLTVTVYRQGETLELTITVGRQVQSANESTVTESSQSSQNLYDGIQGFHNKFLRFVNHAAQRKDGQGRISPDIV